jgi:hypothetical protein
VNIDHPFAGADQAPAAIGQMLAFVNALRVDVRTADRRVAQISR